MNTGALVPHSDVLTIHEAAQVARVHASLLRTEIRAGRLRAYRAGAVLLRILREDLLEWLCATPAQIPTPLRDPRRHGRVPSSRPLRAKEARS